MKKSLLSVMAVGLMAVAANADTIGLRWTDTPDQKHDGPGVAELVLTQYNPGDFGGGQQDAAYQYSGAGGFIECVSGDCTNLTFTNWSQTRAGWGVTGFPGPVGVAALASGANTASDVIDGVTVANSGAETILATVAVGYAGLADGSEKGFALNFIDSAAGVLDGGGSGVAWHGTYGALYSGYIAYGNFGGNEWDGGKSTPGQAANPLIITKIPEPTSMALIALGGFALLRRSR